MDNRDLPVAVIGSGAGGLPTAVALAEEGVKVILIEKGKEVLSSSFVTHRYDYELRSSPWKQDEKDWKGPVKLQRGKGLGGSTLYFQAVSKMPKDKVLNQWGLPIREVGVIANEVRDFLQIAGVVQPSHTLNPVSQYLFDSAVKNNWKASHTEVAILSKPHQDRPICNYCGLCVYGCKPGDKGSVNNTWLPRAKRAPLLRLLTETNVESIVLSSNDTVKSLNVQKKGESSTNIPVRAIVVAAGALESPYILKNSYQSLAPNGIGNINVGRNLTATLWQSLLVTVPKSKGNGFAGIPIDMEIQNFENEGILLYQSRNMAGISGPVSAARHYTNVKKGRNVKEWMRKNYNYLAGLGAYAESSTEFKDGIVDSNNGKKYQKLLSTKDDSTLLKMRQYLQQWSQYAEAHIISSMPNKTKPYVGAMFRGTCRMGVDPEKTAVNNEGKLHDYTNIYISDASILGRGLIAHPSLSLQVLGVYIGRQLAKRLKAV